MSDYKGYESGMVKVATPRCGDICRDYTHEHFISVVVSEPIAFLPHSCDEWIIGGRAQVEAMIYDLQEALKGLPDQARMGGF